MTQPTDKEVLIQMITGFWLSQSIHATARLGIADELIAGPQTAEELARRSGMHAESVYRLMRAMASIGIFAEDGHRRFSLTSLADNLRSDSPEQQRWLAIVNEMFYPAWGNLLHSVRTGEPAFQHTYGKGLFEYLSDQPELSEYFDRAMTGIHGHETEPMIDAYDFGRYDTLVDVGGGSGSVLAAILRRCPSVTGVLFDLPGARQRAEALHSDSGLAGRYRCEEGSFFEGVTAGGDCYLLRHIVHDWLDPEAVTILRNCREAMNPGGRVVVVESVIPPGNDPFPGKWLDLMMLVIGGKERTEEQYHALYAQAGLKISGIYPTPAGVSIVEGVAGSAGA